MNAKKGIVLGMAIAVVFLIAAVGSASANGVCWIDSGSDSYHPEGYYKCGDLVNYSCTLNATMTCSSGLGLKVNNDTVPITINGYNATNTAYYAIDGSSPGDCVNTYRSGIYNYNTTLQHGYDNVTLKNLEIKNFCFGIRLKGNSSNRVENNTIDNCSVHDNGDGGGYTMGIDVYKGDRCNITNCTVYNNTGEVITGCGTGGHGINLYGCGCEVETFYGHHNVTNNTIYNNTMAGIYSKNGCKYNNISYNKVYENGKVVGGATSYFGGGIRLECMNTDNWTVSYNTVTDNYGPGVFVRGDYNNITHNDVTNNKNASSVATGVDVGVGYGIFIHSQGEHNNITYNRVCNNNGTDIYNDSDATNTFDENICNKSHPDGLCEYDCVDAYKYQVDNSPGANNPNIEFNTTEYANARVDDDVRACNKTTSNGNYAAHRFNFTVREPAAKIDKIKVIWNGIGDHDSAGATDGAKLYIYNFNSGSYGNPLDSDTTTDEEITLTGEKTSSISNYINSNNVTILVNQTSAHGGRPPYSHIRTDLVKIVIYFKHP
ncbi:MAG TPA: hypothetical protein C5S37_01670 [Methanophagales archaeon]|nr:hypothetical protein [Methanophagales archaeon]